MLVVAVLHLDSADSDSVDFAVVLVVDLEEMPVAAAMAAAVGAAAAAAIHLGHFHLLSASLPSVCTGKFSH